MADARMKGRTFRALAWSKDWATRVPWSLDGEPMPYIGSRMSKKGEVWLTVFGPIGLVSVHLPNKVTFHD